MGNSNSTSEESTVPVTRDGKISQLTSFAADVGSRLFSSKPVTIENPIYLFFNFETQQNH